MANSTAASGDFGDRLKSLPERIKVFYNDVRTETRKVTAPSWKDVQATTIVVVITVFFFGLFFFVYRLVFCRRASIFVQLFRALSQGGDCGVSNSIMQDEEKNEAGAGGEQPPSETERCDSGASAAQPEYEVVHHSLVFRI